MDTYRYYPDRARAPFMDIQVSNPATKGAIQEEVLLDTDGAKLVLPVRVVQRLGLIPREGQSNYPGFWVLIR